MRKSNRIRAAGSCKGNQIVGLLSGTSTIGWGYFGDTLDRPSSPLSIHRGLQRCSALGISESLSSPTLGAHQNLNGILLRIFQARMIPPIWTGVPLIPQSLVEMLPHSRHSSPPWSASRPSIRAGPMGWPPRPPPLIFRLYFFQGCHGRWI